MMRTKYLYFCLFSLLFSQAFAQNYTDYKPIYKKWSPSYIVDKIEYTSTRTIVYFRYISTYDYNSVTYYGKDHEDRWVFENVDNPDETYPHIDVKNIKKNGELLLASLTSSGKDQVTYSAKTGDVLTCEVHFRRLPNKMKKGHFLEGKNQKASRNHFHALNVKLKTSEDPDLGSYEDMVNIVQNFERQNIGRPKTEFRLPPKQNNTKKITTNNTQVKITPPKKPIAPRLKPPTMPEYPQEAQTRS
ncbi:MAG: hypothetical protein SFU27_05545 [Thermonemataceae bacterium]|nr:hypothetical protein [Thermonemataceae bacterium]